jgi:glucosamine-6-phosphate deaminase
MIRVEVFAARNALARTLARDIAEALSAKPNLVLGLATGRTPIPLYDELARLHSDGRADFRQVITFNLDEFLGVTPSDPRGYHAFMRRHLFARVNLDPTRINFLHGTAGDPRAECVRYERAIARAGGIDIQILGLGMNGHIGFNEPGRALIAATHRVRLTMATRRANAALFGNRVRNVPKEALSMGMATILRARRIVLLSTGASKARCVERMLRGQVTTRLPASFLQLHANAEVWLDRASASRLALQGRPAGRPLHP